MVPYRATGTAPRCLLLLSVQVQFAGETVSRVFQQLNMRKQTGIKYKWGANYHKVPRATDRLWEIVSGELLLKVMKKLNPPFGHNVATSILTSASRWYSCFFLPCFFVVPLFYQCHRFAEIFMNGFWLRNKLHDRRNTLQYCQRWAIKSRKAWQPRGRCCVRNKALYWLCATSQVDAIQPQGRVLSTAGVIPAFCLFSSFAQVTSLYRHSCSSRRDL